MSESRFQRWSRKKQEERDVEVQPPQAPVEPELTEQEQALIENEALSESEVLEKYDLPDPDKIELGMDITGFMQKEIPEMLRRRALRSLWRSNPVLAVLGGLNDYDEDYSNAATAMKGYQTIYKVGQGMVDRSKKAEQALEDLDEAAVIPPDSMTRDVKPPESRAALNAPPPAPAEPVLEAPESEPATEIQEDSSEDETPSAPVYRPRMRFH